MCLVQGSANVKSIWISYCVEFLCCGFLFGGVVRGGEERIVIKKGTGLHRCNRVGENKVGDRKACAEMPYEFLSIQLKADHGSRIGWKAKDCDGELSLRSSPMAGSESLRHGFS